jgi:hypothetical protein
MCLSYTVSHRADPERGPPMSPVLQAKTGRRESFPNDRKLFADLLH